MQNLEELALYGSFATFSNFTSDKIHLNSIKRFEHCGQKLSYPFLFDQLEFFLMDDKVTEDVYDFIDQHQTIKTLSFINYSNESINVSRLMNVIPSLTEIEIVHFKLISIDDIVNLVSSFKILNKLVIPRLRSTRERRKELLERLGDEWQIPPKKNIWIHLERIDRSANE